MKTISILKKLITIYYYIMLLGLIVVIIGFPLGIINSGAFKNNFLQEVPDDINLQSWKIYTVATLFLLIYILFVRAIWLLQNSLPDLAKGSYFSELVIKNFKIIGILFLSCGIGYLVNQFITNLLLLGVLKFGFDDAVYFQIIMGLLFLYLSKIFLKGRKMKEENELTI